MATEGTFVLADIGGYTRFLTGVGIEHGKEITEDLLNHLLKCNRGRWKLANVEGDCIFFYREGRERRTSSSRTSASCTSSSAPVPSTSPPARLAPVAPARELATSRS